MQLVTRLDFDGLVCAAMLLDMERIDEINFANPKDIEESRVFVDLGDAIAHLPFKPDIGLWFHTHDFDKIHPSKLERVRGKWAAAPSTAQLIYDYYNTPDLDKYKEFIDLANRINTAQITKEEVLNPTGWMLVIYTLDPRFAQEHEYGMKILGAIRRDRSIEELIADEMVQRRVNRYQRDEERFIQEMKENTKTAGTVIFTDFRDFTDPPRGNRFRAFIEYPEGNVHIRVDQHRDPMKYLVSVSKSPFNKTCKAHIGKLMETYTGGGAEGAGTCPIAERTANERLKEIIKALQ